MPEEAFSDSVQMNYIAMKSKLSKKAKFVNSSFDTQKKRH